jgi:hypothetical protein
MFPNKTLYAFFISPIFATCLVHLILLDFIILISGMSTNYEAPLLPRYFPLGPDNSNPLSHLNLCSSLSVRHKVSCPYKTGKIII